MGVLSLQEPKSSDSKLSIARGNNTLDTEQPDVQRLDAAGLGSSVTTA